MKVSLKLLEKLKACQDGVDFYKKVGQPKTVKECIEKAIEHKQYKYGNWFIVRCMEKVQKVQYAIFAAEQVLYLFEEKYTNDKRPRKAIEAAKNWINNPAANPAAADAAYAAAYDADADAADAADAYAADAAYAAASAYAATYDAYAADAAAYAYAYAAAADAELRIKILNYGLEILGVENDNE